MAKFMIRVVLHDHEAATKYTGLNAAMLKRGFARELPGKKASYCLPTGDYWIEGNHSPSDVRVRAAHAAESTGEDFGIAVVRVDGWSVMRLKKAEATSHG